MVLRRDSYTVVEDETIIEVVMDYARRGEKIYDAFDYLGEILTNRTISSIRQRWYGPLAKRVKRQMEREKALASRERGVLATDTPKPHEEHVAPLSDVKVDETKSEPKVARNIHDLSTYINLLHVSNLEDETLALINKKIRELIS